MRRPKAVLKVAHNISGVADGANGVSQATHEAQTAAAKLAELSHYMEKLVCRFKY